MQKSISVNEQKNKLSVFSIILLVIGSCIGSGIFYKNQSILQGNQGSILLSIVCWLIVGASAIFIAFSLGEICSIKYDRPALGLLGWVKTFNNRFIYRCCKYYLCFCYWPILTFGLTIYFVESICLAFNWNIAWYLVTVFSLCVSTWFIFMTGIFTKVANVSNWIISCFKFIPLVFAIIIGYVYVGAQGNIYTGGASNSQGWLPSGDQGNKTPLFNDLNIGFGMLSTFPAILFAMNGFQYAPSLQHEMKEPKKLSFSMNVGICLVLGIYIALSISLMICCDGSIKDLQSWLDYKNLHWLYMIIQLLISIGILSVINGTAASASRMYEDLIIHDELIGSSKFNKAKLNIHKPISGVIYFYIVTVIFTVIFIVIGVFFVNDTGIKFISFHKNTGISKIIYLNDHTGGIFSFVDTVTSWTALFFFIITGLSIFGCLRNRKTNKIHVIKNKLFVPSAYISIIVIGIATLFYVVGALVNPFIVGGYLSNNAYEDHDKGIAELITTLLTLTMLFINIGASAIPAIIETNSKRLKYLKERNKKTT